MNDLNQEYELKFFKSKNVKSPAKAWDAAGWDFFIPENLTVNDFAKNRESFFNDNNYYKKPGEYGYSAVFFVNVQDQTYEVIFLIGIDSNDNKTLLMKVFQDHKIIDQFNYDDVINGTCNNEVAKSIVKNDSYITKMIIDPFGRILIPSGIHVNLPENIFLKAENKSGIASKRGLIAGASVVDQDYEGEVHINVINASNNAVIIKPGEKIIQFVAYFQPIMKNIQEFSSLEELYKNKNSQRGAGGFGSSGTK